MNIDLRRTFVYFLAGVGLLAATSMNGCGPYRVRMAEKAELIVADWPEPSRLVALEMIEKNGEPDRRDDDSLTWFGLYLGRRTVVHRSSSSGDVVEQVVLYPVPAAKVAALALFDRRLAVDRNASEISVRTDSPRTNFLILNLAHEIASGFKTVDEAQQSRENQMRLALAGKSSRYRDGLIFEQPLPTRSALFILPSGAKRP